jgi:hypothetical protein
VRRPHQDEFPPFQRDQVDIGGVISVLRCAGFRVDAGILGVNRECTAGTGFEEEPRG